MCLQHILIHFLTRRSKCSMTRWHWSYGMSCIASTIAAFSSYTFRRSLPQSLSFKIPISGSREDSNPDCLHPMGDVFCAWCTWCQSGLRSTTAQVWARRVPPLLAGTPGVAFLWTRSFVKAVSTSEIRSSNTGHYYWLRLVLRAHIFEKYSSGLLYMDSWWSCTIYYMLLYSSKFLHFFRHHVDTFTQLFRMNCLQPVFFSFDQKL